jgi:putative phosphoribosyl transferase
MDASNPSGVLTERNGFVETSVRIPADSIQLRGTLRLPACAEGIVLFAHGSGSSRLSPHNNHVAKVLRDAGVATLLFDLLSEAEADDRAKVFNVELLAERLRHGTEFIRRHAETAPLRLGYFGASTGAAAAVMAAAADATIGAIVSRGGRPDLAGDALRQVQAPTLFIVGGDDTAVIDFNQAAYAQLNCVRQLAVVPGAGHLFEEPGALKKVASLASEWFARHLTKRA